MFYKLYDSQIDNQRKLTLTIAMMTKMRNLRMLEFVIDILNIGFSAYLFRNKLYVKTQFPGFFRIA